MKKNGYINFIRSDHASSASKIMISMMNNEMIEISDSKFCGDDLVIMQKSTLDKIRRENNLKLCDFTDRHLTIIDKLLDMKKI